MRIEKFVHSCLRLTLHGKRLLFDPGKFSFVDRRVDPRDLSDVDFSLFTHGHPDHLDCEALRTIVGDGERLFLTTRDAGVLVLAASPNYTELAINRLGGEEERFNATPAITGDRLLLRSDRALYCVKKEKN